MIPKKIHYCWFGQNPLPESAARCIQSWKKNCPDYEIIKWDEGNCDLEINDFVAEAAKAKKWAFVSDYFRLKIIEEHGGIYFDVDVELLRSLDKLLTLEGFMGFELGADHNINTGHGFGARPNHPLIEHLRKKYEMLSFRLADGSFDTTPCPVRDTRVLVSLGLQRNNKKQKIMGITFFPAEYFSPRSFFGEEHFTDNTYSIHHYHASWADDYRKKINERRKELVHKYGPFAGKTLGIMYATYHEMRHYGLSSLIAKIRQKLKP